MDPQVRRTDANVFRFIAARSCLTILAIRLARCVIRIRSSSIRTSQLVLLLFTFSCHEPPENDSSARRVVISDASRDPGSLVVPTNEFSLALIGSDPSSRREWFRSTVITAGNQCTLVTSAILKAGDDGIDLWRVGCSDAAWLVTLGPALRTSVDSCSTATTDYCTDETSTQSS